MVNDNDDDNDDENENDDVNENENCLRDDTLNPKLSTLNSQH